MGSPYEKKYIELTEEDRAKVLPYIITGSRKDMKKTYEKNVPEFCYSASFEEVQEKRLYSCA